MNTHAQTILTFRQQVTSQRVKITQKFQQKYVRRAITEWRCFECEVPATAARGGIVRRYAARLGGAAANPLENLLQLYGLPFCLINILT